MSFQATLRDHFHWFHRHPEVSHGEHETTAHIRGILIAAGVEVLALPLKTGLVARIAGPVPGPTVALRADIDALPVTETTGLPYASERPGVMHACGHDFHTTALLGAALLLQEKRSELCGTVLLVFQAAEEAADGAVEVIATGVLDGVAEIYGQHVDPKLPAGTIAVCPGGLWAAVGRFTALVTGRGGHAAYPHTVVDPIVAAAQFIGAAQTIVSRDADPFDAAVVSITHIEAGSTWNVIPGECRMEGTLRSLNTKRLEAMAGRLAAIARGVAEATGTAIDYRWDCPAAAVDNDPALTAFVADTARACGFPVASATPSLGGEDFARYQERIRGSYWNIGVASPQALHQSGFIADSAALHIGAELLAAVAEAALKRLGKAD